MELVDHGKDVVGGVVVFINVKNYMNLNAGLDVSNAGSVVLVDYTVSGNKYTADIVYILKVADDGTNPNPNPGTSTLTLAQNGQKVAPTFTNKTGSAQNVTITFYYRVANSGADYSTYSTATSSVANNATNTWTSSGLTLPTFNTATSYQVYAVAHAGETVLATSSIYNFIG